MNDILTRFLLSKGGKGLMGMLGGQGLKAGELAGGLGLQQTTPAPGIGTPDYSWQVPPIAPGLPNTGFSIDSIPGGTFPSEAAYQAGWSQTPILPPPLGNMRTPRVPMTMPSPIPNIPMTIPSPIPNMVAKRLPSMMPGMPPGTGVLWDYINRVNKP